MIEGRLLAVYGLRHFTENRFGPVRRDAEFQRGLYSMTRIATGCSGANLSLARQRGQTTLAS